MRVVGERPPHAPKNRANLDECDIIGGILNSAVESKKSLRYLTDGQRVRNDIQKASKNNLMEKVKGLELEVYMNNV